MAGGLKAIIKSLLITPEIEATVARMPKPVGSFGFDAWGYHADAVKVGFALAQRLYDHYFRVSASGLEHIPAQGRALIIANHSGQLPFDAVMTGVAMMRNPSAPRAPRAMFERFLPGVPWVGNLLNGLGGVVGDPINCAKMLAAEEAILVFPEGVRGSGKPYRQRYQLQRFGRGFMHLAIQHRTPIIPLGIVGCEETMPSLSRMQPLAKCFGLPYLPLAFPLPLPARIYLNFGAPMWFDEGATTEADIDHRVEQVKARITELMADGLAQRKTIF